MTWMSRLFAAFLVFYVAPALASPSLTAQRAQFKKAWAAAQNGDLATLTPYLGKLANYPLYPYLRYAYLDSTLAQQPDDTIKAFLQQQWALPVANDLATDWLQVLAKRQDWQTILDNYQDQTDPASRCAVASAHLAGKDSRDRDAWTVVAEHLWLSPQQQPESCIAAFQYLNEHHLITGKMLIRRTELALRAHQYSVAKDLLPQLKTADQAWVQAWLQMAADPRRFLLHARLPDSPHYQQLLLDGVRLVARTDPARGRYDWDRLKRTYHFGPDDRNATERLLALQYAWHLMPHAGKWLARVRVPNHEVLTWRVRSALRKLDWRRVLKDIDALGRDASADEWRYWKARALAETGHAKAAKAIYKSLAKGDGYYAYLAADHLDQAYDFPQQASQPAAEVMTQLGLRPAFLRARELVHVGLFRYAEEEWHAGVDGLSNPAKCQAALLAFTWHWYGRTIRTLANAGCWQDLTFTYPIAYPGTLLPQLQKLQIDPAWVYGLIRAESMFLPGAVSNAGAIGLMQLMPATGRHWAGRIGMNIDDDHDMQDPHTNLTLGTHYLQYLLKRFHGSEPLATAAYNAGATRVTEWLPVTGTSLPADVWVDTIPYDQTRNYVRRVLTQAVVFDWRLSGGKPLSLTARLAKIPMSSNEKSGPSLARR